MSITVKARPFLLLSDFIDIFTSVNNDEKNYLKNFYEMNNQVENIIENQSNEKNVEISNDIAEILSKQFDTIFVSNDVLLKTLNEHGFENIVIEKNNITCELDDIKILFFKDDNENIDNEPFKMSFSFNCSEDKIFDLYNDIKSEYSFNSQEENYKKIKERLKKHGLSVDDEEVYEDNTIVLTVNID